MATSKPSSYLLRLITVSLMLVLVSATVEVSVSTKNSANECVAVSPDTCLPYDCNAEPNKYYKCTTLGYCAVYPSSDCSGDSEHSIHTYDAPCALLPNGCTMAVVTNPKLLLEVSALNDTTLTAHTDGQLFTGAFMVSPTDAKAQGFLPAVFFTTSAGDELRFEGLSNGDTVVETSAGSCELGNWCSPSASLAFRVSNTTGVLDAGGFVVLQESIKFTLNYRWSVQTAALHQFFVNSDVIFDPNTMKQMTLNIAYGQPFYDNTDFPAAPAIISDFVLNRAENTVTYTYTLDGEEPVTGNTLVCYPNYSGLSHLLWDCDGRLLQNAS